MTLFTVGPVEMYPTIQEVSSKQLPYFRNASFSNIMFELQERMLRLLHLKDGLLVTLTGSGSAAMESLCCCSFRNNQRVLIINGGSFGQRFSSICDCYHIPHDDILLPFPQRLTADILADIDGSKYCALLVNMHETSTGQLYDMQCLSQFAKKYHLYLIVDAISSFIADPLDMDDMGIDCVILSSQKALALSPGISFIAMNTRFYHEMIEPKDDICKYLSIKEHVKHMKRGQTPNTPAIGIILECMKRLQEIEIQGLQQVQDEIRKRALYFRKQCTQLSFTLPPFTLSNALTPIIVDGCAQELYHYLIDHHDLTLTPSGGTLQHTMLRVSHLGNLTLHHYDTLIQGMKEFGL